MQKRWISSAQSKHDITRFNHEVALWLHSLADWKVAGTFTLARVDPVSGRTVNVYQCRRAFGYFIGRLNKAVFKNGCTRHGYRVASAYVLEGMVDGHHPHIHFSLSAPPHMAMGEFIDQVEHLAQKNSLFLPERHITRYRDSNWMSYCMKDGIEGLAVEDVQLANP